MAVEATIGIIDSAGATRLVRSLDESGAGAGPWRNVTERSYGDLRNNFWRYAASALGIANTTTPENIIGAPGVGLRNYVTGLQLCADALTNATELVIRETSGAVLWRIKIQTSGIAIPVCLTFEPALKPATNVGIEAVTLTASGAGGVYLNAQGYIAA